MWLVIGSIVCRIFIISCVSSFGVYRHCILSGCVNADSRYEFEWFKKCRSQWPRGLCRGSAASRLLGLRFRIPPEAWTCVCCDCCEVEVSAMGRSLGRSSPPECGVSECACEASITRRPWPTKGYCVMRGGGRKKTKRYFQFSCHKICLLYIGLHETCCLTVPDAFFLSNKWMFGNTCVRWFLIIFSFIAKFPKWFEVLKWVFVRVCLIFPVYNRVWLKWNFAHGVCWLPLELCFVGIDLDTITGSFGLISIVFASNGWLLLILEVSDLRLYLDFNELNKFVRHAVVQLVEALRYKPEGRGCH